MRGDDELMRESVTSQIYEHTKQASHLKQYGDFARTPDDIIALL